MSIYVLIIVILICLCLYQMYYNETRYIKSNVDNKYYLIRTNSHTSEQALDSANMLAHINQKVESLIQHLLKKYQSQFNGEYHFVRILAEKYNHNILSEAAIDHRYTTFTIDKEEMHICLRTRDGNENLYEINLLLYVVLHELAHLCNYDRTGHAIEGHGKEFATIFRILVENAIEIGIYQYTDYEKKPQEYCGMILHTSIV